MTPNTESKRLKTQKLLSLKVLSDVCVQTKSLSNNYQNTFKNNTTKHQLILLPFTAKVVHRVFAFVCNKNVSI